ncbi:hypothetical protein CYMTET_24564 [Cymbomonas tetramitiformis]|uniref:DUF7869 domain-containing protein n=1 Tax=Cymbomonas tetramitiformis TaxID=36881 RepID=A0AAE0FVT6_9CHLO|nr:hypothetical protein CYMTET_24564 [Cymbomonas tetramitiformis]
MFSRFSVALCKVNAWDIETLMEVARDSFKEMKPECALIEEVHDIKGWLSKIDPKNNPDGCYHQVNDVSYQHCFKVELDSAENVIVQGKRYSFDPEWLPKNGIQILAKKQMEKKKKPSDPLQEIEELVKDCKRNLGLDVRRVGETLKEQELKAHAERANIFLENYAKMQRDIEEGNFVLQKTTPWQMPDGYSAIISGNSGLDTHRHVVNDTGELGRNNIAYASALATDCSSGIDDAMYTFLAVTTAHSALPWSSKLPSVTTFLLEKKLIRGTYDAHIFKQDRSIPSM